MEGRLMGYPETLLTAQLAGMIPATQDNFRGFAPDGFLMKYWADVELDAARSDGSPVITWRSRTMADPDLEFGAWSPSGALDAILRVDPEFPESALEFVDRYGPLEISREGEMVGFEPELISRKQPFAWYVDLSNELNSLIRISAHVRHGRSGSPLDWAILRQFAEHRVDVPERITISRARLVVSGWLGWWLATTRIGPYVVWHAEEPQINLGGVGLLAAIALQTSFAVTRTGTVATCAGCGRPFLPSRQPRPNTRSWCPQCGKKARDRQAQRDRRRGRQRYRSR